MTDTGGVGSAGGVGGADKSGGADSVGRDDGSVSESEAASVASDAVDTSDEDAATVGETIAAADATDTFEVTEPEEVKATEIAEAELEEETRVADEVLADAELDEAAVEEAPVEEPSLVESVAAWAGETAKGYATGAVNGVLDMANLANMGANGVLGAVGVDYRFETDMGIAPTSDAEKAAQDAVAVASVVAGGVGLVRAAPAIGRTVAQGVDDVADLTRSALQNKTTPVAGAQTAAQVAKLGDLRPAEIARIQAAADELGADLYVVGSAAKGARRNVDTDLPLAEFGGAKAGTRSDIDYAVRNGLDDAASELDLPDMDGSWGVRGVDYLNLDSSPAIRFSPGQPPTYLSGGGRLNLD